MRYGLFLTLLLVVVVHGSPVPGQPNFVVILTDDQGWNATSTQVAPDIPESASVYYRTPNLDRLIRQGMAFSRAYSSSPTCGPSRHSIQYGRSPVSLQIFASMPWGNREFCWRRQGITGKHPEAGGTSLRHGAFWQMARPREPDRLGLRHLGWRQRQLRRQLGQRRRRRRPERRCNRGHCHRRPRPPPTNPAPVECVRSLQGPIGQAASRSGGGGPAPRAFVSARPTGF